MLLTITALGKTVLLLAAGTFIAFAFVTAIVIPRRNPGFPRNVSAFVIVSALLFAAQMSAVLWVTNTQEVEEESSAEATPGETGPTETGSTETAPAETGPAETTPAAGGDVAAGKQLFEQSGCASCHTLADANAHGTVGPNLDEAKPSADLVVERVTSGKSPMPSFKASLSEQQIADIAAYVSSVAGT